MATKKTAAKKSVNKSAAPRKRATQAKQPYVIARCTQAGVHSGYLVSRDRDGYVVLRDARRLYEYYGAATLSEIAVYGLNPAKSDGTHFAALVAEQELLRADVCELIHCQPAGIASITSHPEWRA